MKPLRRSRKDVVLLASCVDSGPPHRLVQNLVERGLTCQVVAEYDADGWRTQMSQGPVSRLRARLRSTLIYPMRVLIRAIRSRPQCVIATTNPFILPIVLVATRPLHRACVVGLLYDLIPDALQVTRGVDPGHPGYRLAAFANRFWIRHADGVVFLSERMAEYTWSTYGKPRRSGIIGVGADPREFRGAALGEPGPCSDLERWCEGRVIASYVGNLGLSHDWDTLAAAIPQAIEHSDLRCVVCASGPGVEILRHAWRNLDSDRVRFAPPLDDLGWARLLARSAISLVTVRQQSGHIPIGFPSKLYSAMAAGSAIVAVAPPGSDPAAIVTRHDCGVVVVPGEADVLATALARLASDAEELLRLRRNARYAVEKHYDIGHLAQRWQAFLAEAVHDQRPATIGFETTKRLIDVVLSASALVALMPLLGAIAFAIRVTMGCPVVFRQPRAGKAGKPFELLKFRTMHAPRVGEEGPEHDVSRLTRLGRWLRATSVDELPALWNVVRGDMSLVGPRPLPLRYLSRYTRHQARRHDVRPGITGWAQINGRNAIGWEERFLLDVEYVENRSLCCDLKILLQTVWKVLRAEGISQPGHATMSEFFGGGPERRHDA